MRMANENENLQDLLVVAALHNPRPPVIEPTSTTTTSPASPMDRLLGLLDLAANQGDESDNTKAMAGWEGRNHILAVAINETIQQEKANDE